MTAPLPNPMTSTAYRDGLPVPRRSDLTDDEFATDYMDANRPVVISDALQQWPALAKWNPRFFQQQFGTRRIPIDNEFVTVAAFVERVLSGTDQTPAPYLMGTGVGMYFLDLFPELAADIEPTPQYLFPNWLADHYWFPLIGKRLNRGPQAEIFFGGRGSRFPCLHWDTLLFHAFNAQVYGEKDWLLCAPDQGSLLYPNPGANNQSLVENIFEPDLARYPLVVQVTRYECTVRPGELLFIPSGWWHTTRMRGPSISVAINGANASNWKGVRTELVKKAEEKSTLLGVALNLYLKAVGRRKARRDRVHFVGEAGH